MFPLLIIVFWATGCVMIPESPRYLLVAGRLQEGWDTLSEAASQNHSVLFRQKLIRFTTHSLTLVPPSVPQSSETRYSKSSFFP